MIQYATVKKILDDNRAVISVIRESACGKSCASCGGCSEKTRTVTAVANNLCHAEEGERVCVEMPTRQVIGIVSLVYILPLIFLFAACFIANSLGAGEGICILSGAIGVALSFVPIRFVNAKISKSRETECNIISVLSGDQ